MDKERATVLIVEDDSDWRSLLFRYLVDSYDVVALGDYTAAVDVIRTRVFDVLILDVRLVDQDNMNSQGMDLLALLREKEQGQDWSTRVIIVSAYGTAEQIRKGFKMHSLFDYIRKQEFDRQEYQQIVQRAISTRLDRFRSN